MRQFYTAAVQFKLNRRFSRAGGLMEWMTSLTSPKLPAQMAVVASTVRFTPMCPRACCALLKVLNLRTQISGAASQAVPNARSGLMADVVAAVSAYLRPTRGIPCRNLCGGDSR